MGIVWRRRKKKPSAARSFVFEQRNSVLSVRVLWENYSGVWRSATAYRNQCFGVVVQQQKQRQQSGCLLRHCSRSLLLLLCSRRRLPLRFHHIFVSVFYCYFFSIQISDKFIVVVILSRCCYCCCFSPADIFKYNSFLSINILYLRKNLKKK